MLSNIDDGRYDDMFCIMSAVSSNRITFNGPISHQYKMIIMRNMHRSCYNNVMPAVSRRYHMGSIVQVRTDINHVI